MKPLDRTALPNTAVPSCEPCISVYVPGRQDVAPGIRLSRLLEEVEQKLEYWGHDPDAIRELLAPLYELNGQPELEHQTEGLALFRKPGFFRYHAVHFTVPEMCVVADHFYLAPLSHVSDGNEPFYLLALSLGGAKLLEAVSGTVTELANVSFPGSPIAMADQRDGQRDRRYERSVRGGFAILHRYQALDNRTQALLGWFRRIDEVMTSRFHTARPPVILVAVQYLCPMFRNASRYQNLLDVEIHGSPDAITADELWQRGSEIASTHFRSEQDRVADKYLRLWYTQRASNNIRDIEVAARQGRIQTLFVGVSPLEEIPSQARDEMCCREPSDQGQRVVELAAINTFAAGGTIYAVPPEQVPGKASAAAVFRY